MSAPSADLLIELGTEELPPKALRLLSNAFSSAIADGLRENRLGSGAFVSYASPRRLAVVVDSVNLAQEDRQVTQKGPPVRIGIDADGNATKAGIAFAKKCGVEIDALSRQEIGNELWLVCSSLEVGRQAAELLPGIIQNALDSLPIPRRMRWGEHDVSFVRPVHWLIILHGNDVVPGTVLNVHSGRTTRGHRFLSAGEIEIKSPSEYAATLKSVGFVLAAFDARMETIIAAVTKAAGNAGGTAIGDGALFEEVTALTEWPVAITGSFDESYLALPKEVIIETLTHHQRYFPVADRQGKLLPVFVTIANLDSLDPKRVRHGNERVIRPRLADAVFFWETDRQIPLDQRREALKKVVYQKGLGTLHEKSLRVATLASMLAEQTGVDAGLATRAAMLAKCDLLTDMVGEFPELQGVMGRHYAASAHEPEAVCQAIGEQYLPRFAGDDLPESDVGQVLAVADRLDTLAGVFLLGSMPTGNRDPFGLRRASLGIVRILIEKNLDVNLFDAVAAAARQQPISGEDQVDKAKALYDFIIERLRGYFVEGTSGFTVDMFEAVRARRPVSLVDFHARLVAVADFLTMDASGSLAAANKRTANILRQAAIPDQKACASNVQRDLLHDDAERVLYQALHSAQKDVAPLIESRRYSEALRRLAQLRIPVDAFFEDVMVMVDDDALKNNRLALLSELRDLFLGVADVSRLTPAQE